MREQQKFCPKAKLHLAGHVRGRAQVDTPAVGSRMGKPDQAGGAVPSLMEKHVLFDLSYHDPAI